MEKQPNLLRLARDYPLPMTGYQSRSKIRQCTQAITLISSRTPTSKSRF